ncbi:hypothetical protein GLOIN_2v1774914 [Rhizophagus irregularis DAOM 181602=DAOM 197198]|uniref:Uncharacterized protein n=1 Tax=Rhizophagus irregularis (strain DAOM 181602 / DAOM 197198 / MUCL 43194) TaxID=747089 RepID=A0A2P4Q110_RHIID|nr:hypothetical protein GLOIN_2v1774914 [Rhizophagus irregularis DAOM 181602=DAOM 197198]POG71331.1 hypothetical protein GLOIN_2v1774914 [Rhizophagus irregularis DAOM 181602=DAOM 197198]|eukprot:XP_025178197.1 hypothetical protein GLOIN_2v1774914 [Rhizophagus irregularis DAOM 181602=DAOM 197198]
MPDVLPEIVVLDVDLSNAVVDQRNNIDIKASKEKEMDAFLVEIQQDDCQRLISDLTHCEEDLSMTSTEPVTLPEQTSVGISPVKSSMADKQVPASESYEDADTECQKILYNQKVDQRFETGASSCTKGSDGKVNKAVNIQIPELSLEAILTGSSEVTAQIIVDLLRVTMKLRFYAATNTDDVGYEDFVPNWNRHVTLKTNKTEVQVNPLEVTNHDDEESIEGRYKAVSYFIKCKQHEIEIVA